MHDTLEVRAKQKQAIKDLFCHSHFDGFTPNSSVFSNKHRIAFHQYHLLYGIMVSENKKKKLQYTVQPAYSEPTFNEILD